MPPRRGFTLIEILVVVAIIALLISILIPSLARARANARRAVCTSNVHQIVIATNMYAMQHPRQIYLPISGTGGYDGLRFLYPTYIRTFNVAVCPATKNVVRRVQDLDDNADNRDDDRGGHSYESRGWMYPRHTYNGKRITGDPLDPTMNSIFSKSLKNIDRPAQVCLLTDADDDTSPYVNNWPDAHNNHGVEGMNAGYCDGHARFVRTGRQLIAMFLSGYYDPGLPSALYQQYNVTRNSLADGWTEFKW
jgi:prepilin-type N-terminal cleavage/methylation domain-containing protein/prepilin-type processing-associated H-X9-DG protein